MTAHGPVGGIAHEQREPPSGLSPFETLLELERWIVRANSYADSRKNKFRFLATVVKLLSLVLSAVATVILGLQDLDFWAGLAFSLVALTTVINAVEPFFNWRARWVLMEAARYRFHRLENDLRFLLVKTTPDAVPLQDVEGLYRRYKTIWDDLSLQWLEHRRGAGSGQG